MSCLTRSTFIGTAMLIAVSLGACAPKVTTTGTQRPAQPTAPTPQAPAAPVNAPTKVAVLVPISASQRSAAQLGQSLGNAAKLAVREAADPLVTVHVYDTGGDPARARAAANTALAEGANIILGPLLGSSTRAVAEPAAAAGVKVISFSTDSRAAGDPVYLSGFLPEVAARRVVSFARSRGYSQLGVLYRQDAYGDQAIKGARSAGGSNIVASTSYVRSNEGIPPAAQAFATDARAAGAQAVLVADSGQALRYVGALLQNYGLDPAEVKYLGLGEWNSRETLGETSLAGGWFAAPDPAAMRSFVEKYEGSFGEVPPALAVLGYDAAKIAVQLAAEARANRSADPFSAQALTRSTGFRGAVGPIRFDPNGIGTRGMAILEVGDGVFQTIDPVPYNVGS